MMMSVKIAVVTSSGVGRTSSFWTSRAVAIAVTAMPKLTLAESQNTRARSVLRVENENEVRIEMRDLKTTSVSTCSSRALLAQMKVARCHA